jgi:hypothetical protein
MLVTSYQTTRRQTTEDNDTHSHRRENSKYPSKTFSVNILHISLASHIRIEYNARQFCQEKPRGFRDNVTMVFLHIPTIKEKPHDLRSQTLSEGVVKRGLHIFSFAYRKPLFNNICRLWMITMSWERQTFTNIGHLPACRIDQSWERGAAKLTRGISKCLRQRIHFRQQFLSVTAI